jgi:hypothetical protein
MASSSAHSSPGENPGSYNNTPNTSLLTFSSPEDTRTYRVSTASSVGGYALEPASNDPFVTTAGDKAKKLSGNAREFISSSRKAEKQPATNDGNTQAPEAMKQALLLNIPAPAPQSSSLHFGVFSTDGNISRCIRVKAFLDGTDAETLVDASLDVCSLPSLHSICGVY